MLTLVNAKMIEIRLRMSPREYTRRPGKIDSIGPNKWRSCRIMITRRSFVIASGLTALASTRVFGANDTIRLGLIGAGQRGTYLLDAAEKAGPYQIVAVCDVYGPNCDAIKERSKGLATTHVDYRE